MPAICDGLARRTGHNCAYLAALTVPLLETVISEIAALHPVVRAWLLEGPLSSHVPSYVVRLRRGRYAASTAGHCLNGVAHFSHWR